MTNKVLVNPQNYKGKYIRFLNQCFPNWGNELQYDWAFERKIGKHASDIVLLANEEDEIIAGSGLSFRMIKTETGAVHNIAIFTGSWTLPTARGRGCFTQIIALFEEICKEKNVPYLTAFVTESNGSYRRFVDLNYYCLEANNILSNENPFENTEEFEILFFENDCPVEFYDTYTEKQVSTTSFQYSRGEFENQYINRTSPTAVVKIEDNWFLVEENASTFRLLFCKEVNLDHIKALANHVLKTKSKKTMFFSTDKSKIAACEAANFNVIKGFFTVKNVAGDQEDVPSIFEKLVINVADKM